MSQFGQLALARRQPRHKLRSIDHQDGGNDDQKVGIYCEDDDDDDEVGQKVVMMRKGIKTMNP